MSDLFGTDPAALAPLHARLPEDLHPTLREMAEVFFLYLVEDVELTDKLGVDHVAGLVIGMLDRAAVEMGGCSFYFPKGIIGKLSARDRVIVAKWNGRNKHQLAREFKLSDMRIDQILNAWRKEEIARRQGNLNLNPED